MVLYLSSRYDFAYNRHCFLGKQSNSNAFGPQKTGFGVEGSKNGASVLRGAYATKKLVPRSSSRYSPVLEFLKNPWGLGTE